VSDTAVSAPLIRKDEGIQKPVYYVSEALIDAKIRYTRIEKLVIALFIAVRKLKHYFQSFPVVVLTEYPLRAIVKNLEASGRIAKWITEIRPLRVTFEPITSIKRRILADFIAEFTSGLSPQDTPLKGWVLNVDGASNSKSVGIGLVLTTRQIHY